MAENTTFQGRFKHKRDTAANWEKVKNTFQPLDGELIIVDTSAGATRFKVGRYDSGKSRLLYYGELPFTDEYLYSATNDKLGQLAGIIDGKADDSEVKKSYRRRLGEVKDEDFNNATVEGLYTFAGTLKNAWKTTDYGTLEVFNNVYNGESGKAGVWLVQMAYTTRGEIYTRYRTNTSSWLGWKKIIYADAKLDSAVTADTATKLKTARTINVSGAAEGPGVSFDGSQSVAIPINSFRESNLSWGGTNVVGNVDPIGAAMSAFHSANRAEGCAPAGVTIEYSTDAGSTWVDYGATDAQKVALMSPIGATAFAIGKYGSRNTNAPNARLRITLNASKMSIYTKLQKVLINLSTNGATNSKVLVEYSNKGSETTWKTVDTYRVEGWSGWNSIPFNCAFGGGDTQTFNWANLRLTFFIEALSSNASNSSILWVYNILLFGTTAWIAPSNFARFGHIYSWDTSQNATFPAKITATAFNGKATSAGTADSATSATKASQDASGNDIVNTYATKNALKSVSDLVGATAVSTQIANAVLKKADVNHTHNNYASTVTTTGNGNAITAISQSGNTITATKGSTFLTDHPAVSKATDSTSTASPVFGGTFTAIDNITRDANGHVTKLNTRTVTIPNNAATTAVSGLMSASDKTKLNGVEEGANKTVVDTTLSNSSTNPVTNQAVYEALAQKEDKHEGIVLIGDSYSQGYTPDSSTWQGWAYYFKQYANLHGRTVYESLIGGSGFLPSGEKNFKTEIQTLAATISESNRAKVYDVILCGGANDCLFTDRSALSSNIQSTFTAINTLFPNATIHMGFCAQILPPHASASLSNYTNLRIAMAEVCNAYANTQGKNVCYIHGLEDVLFHGKGALMSSDGLHPDQDGYKELGSHIARHFNGGTFDYISGWRELPITSNKDIWGTTSALKLRYQISHGMISMRLYVNADSTAPIVVGQNGSTADSTTVIATFTPGAPIRADWSDSVYRIPWTRHIRLHSGKYANMNIGLRFTIDGKIRLATNNIADTGYAFVSDQISMRKSDGVVWQITGIPLWDL